MRLGDGFRLFDRADWRRKVRVPTSTRRAENEKRPVVLPERKGTEA